MIKETSFFTKAFLLFKLFLIKGTVNFSMWSLVFAFVKATRKNFLFDVKKLRKFCAFI